MLELSEILLDVPTKFRHNSKFHIRKTALQLGHFKVCKANIPWKKLH
jgi:hypothetical protein